MDEEAVRGYLPPRAEGGGPSAPPPAPEAPRPLGQAVFVKPGGGETNSAAVAALVLGISGVALTVLFAGWLFFLALPCSVLAWIFGVQGKRKVDRGSHDVGGRGKVGLARAEADDVVAGGLEGLGLGVHGQGGRLLDGGDPVGQAGDLGVGGLRHRCDSGTQ